MDVLDKWFFKHKLASMGEQLKEGELLCNLGDGNVTITQSLGECQLAQIDFMRYKIRRRMIIGGIASLIFIALVVAVMVKLSRTKKKK